MPDLPLLEISHIAFLAAGTYAGLLSFALQTTVHEICEDLALELVHRLPAEFFDVWQQLRDFWPRSLCEGEVHLPWRS